LPPELPELAGVRHTYIEVNGFRAHVAEAGDADAEPLVMLHGWPQHWWCWHKVIPRLAERYRVICPDLRGHGWSDAPPGGYDKPQLAEDLIGVMDALGLDRVRLIGHDWGAVAGYLACIRHPERFDRYLSLSIAPPFPSGDPKDALGIWRLYYQIPLTAPLLAPRLLSNPGFLRFVIERGTMKEGAMSDADVDLYARAMAERSRVSLAIYRTFVTRELVQVATGRWAGQLRVPTRMIVGEHEITTNAERAMKAADGRADGFRVHELKGVGHFLPEEAPEAVVETALSFFAG
jgi:pimeloyl-ACP methyl ester carboxylesterase